MKIDSQLMMKTTDNKKKIPPNMTAEFCVSAIWFEN